MQGFLITLAVCSVTMSALALFYMAVTPLLAKHYSVTGRYYTWLVIVLGLIIPFRPQTGNAVVRVHVPVHPAAPVIRTGTGIPEAMPVDYLPSTLPHMTGWQITAVIWMMGMIAFLVYHMIRHYRFLKLAARWSEDVTDNRTLTLLQNLKAGMGLSRPMGLKVCGSIGTPMMVGFISPRILLPKADFSEDELCFILKHELIHYRRGDLWYKCLVLAATAVHWFNPIVYMMAKVIDIQCELSCDKEVIRSADPDVRQYYSETIIGVVRYQSGQRTALSTNFYGSRQSLKERIVSIMDMSKKKSGIAVLCAALVLTLGTGSAFTAKAETKGTPGPIKEDIVVSPEFSYGYKFHPNPETYAVYSSYGITVSDDGEMLLYNGERVRLFMDGHSDAEAFFLDEAGTVNLSVSRNASGNITGIERISREKAQEYCSAFFADDRNTQARNTQAPNSQDHSKKASQDMDGGGTQDIEENEIKSIAKDTAAETTVDMAGQNKFNQYSSYGITVSADGQILYYNGQRVKLLADELPDGSFESFWYDEAGTVSLSTIRNSDGRLTDIKGISEEKAQEYLKRADGNNQDVLKGLDEKVENRMKELFPGE